MKKLLEIRKKLKKKKPKFLRQDAHKVKRLKKCWRAPKGIHSKMRMKLRGYRKQPSIGYSSPKKIRGLTPTGLKQIIVHTIQDLKKVKDEAVIISRTVGLKKKLQILKKLQELKFPVLNVKDIDQFIKKAEEKLKKKKEEAKTKEEQKKKAKEAVKKEEQKKKEKPKEEKPEDVEAKEKEEKEKKRKVLEKKLTR